MKVANIQEHVRLCKQVRVRVSGEIFSGRRPKKELKITDTNQFKGYEVAV